MTNKKSPILSVPPGAAGRWGNRATGYPARWMNTHPELAKEIM